MSENILIITGSVREGNYTLKAAKVIEDELKKSKIQFELIEAKDLNLSLPGIKNPNSSASSLQEKVKDATGIILVSPEYHGGVSSVMKLIIDNLGFPSQLAAKPIKLVGVAAGLIGAIKSLEQLRLICSHVGALVMPKVTSIANVQKVFDKDGNCQDPKSEEQIRESVKILMDYIDGHIRPRLALEELIRKEEKD